MTRRVFLGRSAAIASLFAGIGKTIRAATLGNKPPETTTPDRVIETLAAVQEHLLPTAPGVPGAKDVGAAKYLAWVLGDPGFDADIKRFIVSGAKRLEEDVRSQTDHSFVALNHLEQARMLESTAARGSGERWLSTVLTYTLEALLCDPVYGGNPDGIAWRWLQHRPGFPRPPANKRYGRL